MTCTWDRDLIALWAGGDAPPEEAERAEAHLRACPACQELLAQYRQGMNLVAAHQAGARLPARAKRATRRWAVAVAAALLLLCAAGAATQSRAVASVLQNLGWFGVEEVSQSEWEQLQEENKELWEKWKPSNFKFDPDGKVRDENGNVIYTLPTRGSVAEAEKAMGYRPLVPRYLPEGLALSHAEYVPGRSIRDINLVYNDGLLEIVSMPEPSSFTVRVREGGAQVLTVSGEPAVVTRGVYRVGENEERMFIPDAPVLRFSKDGLVIIIIMYQNGYPVDELIKIAESME